MAKKKKRRLRKWVKVFLIILVGGMVLGIGLVIFENLTRGEIVLVDDLQLEVNSEVRIGDLVKEVKEGELIATTDLVDTSKIGKTRVNIEYKDKFSKTKKYSFDVLIVDTIEPVIECAEEITILVGTHKDLLEEVVVTDNSLGEISTKVVGEYDLNEIGNYELKYEATDASGNVASSSFLLIVVSESDSTNNTSGIKKEKTSKGYTIVEKEGVTYIEGVLIVNKTYSLPEDYGSGLTKDVTSNFAVMQADAKALGLNLWNQSGYRSYSTQKVIYNNYVAQDGQAVADTYSARPGHSEHQTGLAFDLNTIDDSFAKTDEGIWVSNNCYKYGFILRYPKGKESITGYMYESWHLRYVGVDLATKLYNDGDWITLEEYFGITSEY